MSLNDNGKISECIGPSRDTTLENHLLSSINIYNQSC